MLVIAVWLSDKDRARSYCLFLLTGFSHVRSSPSKYLHPPQEEVVGWLIQAQNKHPRCLRHGKRPTRDSRHSLRLSELVAYDLFTHSQPPLYCQRPRRSLLSVVSPRQGSTYTTSNVSPRSNPGRRPPQNLGTQSLENQASSDRPRTLYLDPSGLQSDCQGAIATARCDVDLDALSPQRTRHISLKASSEILTHGAGR